MRYRWQTREGMHKGNMGDRIIRGVNSERYPCKPGIFKMIYQLVSEASNGEKA